MSNLQKGVSDVCHASTFARQVQPHQKIKKISQFAVGDFACSVKRKYWRQNQDLHRLPQERKTAELQKVTPPIAQLAEQVPLKDKVVGSTPTGRTVKNLFVYTELVEVSGCRELSLRFQRRSSLNNLSAFHRDRLNDCQLVK